ncbi:hypothetical protein PHYBOEH_010930 [Phytophthora boehmeriae]|uniref:Uncharacterized protein n=1 Tax=Phytophthora boehmeriae TaxID=109152 RepID=A0A8T1VPX3_9STRA|nr:hypothetical protein PHYBOEH_010930 [Phytophthora boehmeriae]
MTSSRLPRTSAVLLAATALAATSTAFDFEGRDDFSQNAGTVSPHGEQSSNQGFGHVESPLQWTSTASSSAWASFSGESSDSGGWNPTLECSGSADMEGSNPVVTISTTGVSNTTPTTSSSSAATATASSTTQDLGASQSNQATSAPTTPTPATDSSASSDADALLSATSSTIDTSEQSSTSSSTTSTTIQTSSESGSNSGHATFGDVTSASGECVVGNPNAYISTAYVDWIWENRIGPNADLTDDSNWNVMTSKNWIMDHIVHNND